MRQFYQHKLLVMGIACLLWLIPLAVSAQTAPGCTTDPATGAVTCPPDTNNNGGTAPSAPDADGDGTPDSVDRCLNTSGPSWNEGCPVDDTGAPADDGTQPDSTTDTSADDAPSPNPVRPGEDADTCQAATSTTARVNLRATPSLDGDIIGVLEPSQLYAVDGIVVSGGETWVGMAGGWVYGAAVIYAGDCPLRQLEVTRTDYRIIREELPPADAGSVFPSDQCMELFDGTILCYQTLLATSDAGTDTGYVPPQVIPGGCFFAFPGGNQCVTMAIPGSGWEPQEPSFPYPSFPDDDGGDGGDGGEDDDDEDTNAAIAIPAFMRLSDSPASANSDGIPYCYDQGFMSRFIATDDQSGYSVLEDNKVSLGFLRAPMPDPQPQPCRIVVPIVRADEPANDGSFPLDVVEAVIQWPPAVIDDEANPLIPIVHLTPNHVVYLDTIRVNDNGDFCAPTAPHGFENCPDDDDPTPIDYQLFSSISPEDSFLMVDALSIAPDPEDTEYNCEYPNDSFGKCDCKGVNDCNSMQNACYKAMTCGGLFGHKCSCISAAPGNSNP